MSKDIRKYHPFPSPEEVRDNIFPVIGSEAYVETTRLKSEALARMNEDAARARVTQSSVEGLSDIASNAISANPNLDAVEMNYELVDIESEGFFGIRGRKYRFMGRVDFYENGK